MASRKVMGDGTCSDLSCVINDHHSDHIISTDPAQSALKEDEEYNPFRTLSSSASINRRRGDGCCSGLDRNGDGISGAVIRSVLQLTSTTTMVRTLRIRLPKARSCLGLIDLQTATEVITIFTLINKVSGFYGILSLFTGAQMSGLQMSMYIWSIGGTGICLWALKQIRDENPIKLVWYAYFFALDFLINILYTVLFASIWILIVSDSDNAPAIGSKTFDSVKSAAGFVDPVHADVTKVHIVATPATNPLKAQTASLIGETGPSNGSTSEGSTLSTMSIAFFWLIKLYFIIIVFSYARSLVVRSHISMASFPSTSTSPWDKLQRRMLSSTYWQEDDEDFKETNRRGN